MKLNERNKFYERIEEEEECILMTRSGLAPS